MQQQQERKPFMTITEWKNQCEFQCLECQKIFRDASTAQKHVFERHGLDTKTYKSKHGLSKMMTKEKQYTCFLCGQSVQWAYGSMFQHSRTHNMTMQQGGYSIGFRNIRPKLVMTLRSFLNPQYRSLSRH